MNGIPAGLRDRVSPALQRHGVPGCSIAVVSETGLLWVGGFGHSDLQSGRPAAADTVYRLFSGTKLFTAVATLQLEERGLLRLSDPVTKFLPEATGLGGVSLLHLLSHRSGLKDTLRAFLSVSFPPDAPPTAAEALARYRLVTKRRPGERVEYRNVNYALLGAVISRVSGVEYRDYVRAHVLEPLRMEAGFGMTDTMRTRAATGYIGRLDPARVALPLLFPGLGRQLYGPRAGKLRALHEYDLATSSIGGLVGSMADFATFLRAQLVGHEILAPEAVRRMQTQVATGAAGIESRVGVGLGWKIGSAGGRRFLNHEGGGAGFTSELRLYPELGLGVALGMNAMRAPSTMRLAHQLCEMVVAEKLPRECTTSQPRL
jgi:D-alanyl-D-alanine carboxypeptidase